MRLQASHDPQTKRVKVNNKLMATEDNKWYFNAETGEVAQGIVFDSTNRMGPYDTEEEAKHALAIAAEREEAAEEYDEKGEDWGVAPSWEK